MMFRLLIILLVFQGVSSVSAQVDEVIVRPNLGVRVKGSTRVQSMPENNHNVSSAPGVIRPSSSFNPTLVIVANDEGVIGAKEGLPIDADDKVEYIEYASSVEETPDNNPNDNEVTSINNIEVRVGRHRGLANSSGYESPSEQFIEFRMKESNHWGAYMQKRGRQGSSRNHGEMDEDDPNYTCQQYGSNAIDLGTGWTSWIELNGIAPNPELNDLMEVQLTLYSTRDAYRILVVTTENLNAISTTPAVSAYTQIFIEELD